MRVRGRFCIGVREWVGLGKGWGVRDGVRELQLPLTSTLTPIYQVL